MSQQRDLRRAAAKAFFESLEHLEQTLEPADEKASQNKKPTGTSSKPSPAENSVQFDLASLEDAIADIEQFIQQKEGPEE